MPDSVTIGSGKVVLRQIILPDGLEISELHLEGHELQVDPASGIPWSRSHVSAVAYLTEDALTSYLQQQLPPMIKKVEVQLLPDRVQVAAVAKVILEIQALAVCKLLIVDGTEVHVQLESIEPGGPVRSLVENQLASINPVLRASDLPLPGVLTRAEVSAGVLRVYADLRLEQPQS